MQARSQDFFLKNSDQINNAWIIRYASNLLIIKLKFGDFLWYG